MNRSGFSKTFFMAMIFFVQSIHAGEIQLKELIKQAYPNVNVERRAK